MARRRAGSRTQSWRSVFKLTAAGCCVSSTKTRWTCRGARAARRAGGGADEARRASAEPGHKRTLQSVFGDVQTRRAALQRLDTVRAYELALKFVDFYTSTS